jgi:hypothetical protein
MSVRDSKQPYMVYEGPRPRRPAPHEPLVVELTSGDEGRVDPGSRGHGFGVGLVVVGALAMGVAIGLWAAPNLRRVDAIPQPEPAPLALSLTQPTEAPLREAIDVPTPVMEATPEDPPKAETSKPVRAKPAAARVFQAPQRARKVARNDAARAPKPDGDTRLRTPRAELADWLARSEPAARNPSPEPAGVHEDPVGELIATAEEPPHT